MVLRYKADTGDVLACGQLIDPCPAGYADIPCADMYPGLVLGKSLTPGTFTGHDVWSGTVADLDAWIATGPERWELLAVRECELASQNRAGALASLDAALGA